MADKRGSKPGEKGQPPHKRNEQAARLIERLAGYGLPQSCISDFIEFAIGPGFSIDTIQRHYRAELDRGKAPAKDVLIGRVYAMAMMQDVPKGVTPDRAYAIAADKLMALLNIQHGIMPHQSHRHAGPGGGPIPIAVIEAALTTEEMTTFANLLSKIELAAEQ